MSTCDNPEVEHPGFPCNHVAPYGPKPPEWLHHQDCLAGALIASVQNVRDCADTALDFKVAVQNHEVEDHARDLLNHGLQDCRCPEGYVG